jgi:hypothetical protein
LNKITPKEISRRDAMKILAAVAGAATLSNIPEKWVKPGLEIGVLPAHAQTSLPMLTPGLPEAEANFCSNLTSTVAISPVASGIPMHYVITLGKSVLLWAPVALVGTVLTDSSGVATLIISVDQNTFAFNDTVTVTWTFENSSDGTGSGDQVFTSVGGGC